MTLILFTWVLHNIWHGIKKILLRVMTPILNLFFYVTLLLMVLTWSTIKYLVKFTYILGIWETNCLILMMDMELNC